MGWNDGDELIYVKGDIDLLRTDVGPFSTNDSSDLITVASKELAFATY